uniref:Uncharacterized protein n=1 Tax=Opuntia streptacantha TaxID=393608 RepID=A0A7C8ZWJ2_OPUST
MSGTIPYRKFEEKSSSSTLCKQASENGRGPLSRLLLMSKTVTWLRNPSSYGKQPVNWLLSNNTSFNADKALTMSCGIGPENLLLARVRYSMWVFPRVGGNVDKKLLSFRNRTSRF